MKLTLTSIDRVPLTSKKTGKPFVSVRIKAQEYGDKMLSGFANVDNAEWEVGDVVEANVEEKNGYMNFATLKAEKPPAGDINRVEMKIDALRTEIKTLGGILTAIQGKLGADEPNPDELQF